MPGRTFCKPSVMTRSPYGEAVGDDVGAALLGADRDPLHLYLVLGIDLQHKAAGLIDLDRLLRDHQGSLRLGRLDQGGDQLAVHEEPLGWAASRGPGPCPCPR